jgi:hypothetical protein
MRRITTGLVGMAAAAALVVAGATTPAQAAGPDRVRAKATYSLATTTVGSQTLPMRWNPCQAQITYAVNPTFAARSAAGRRAAVADVQQAFQRLSQATGITFTSAGTTSFMPTGSSWSSTSPAEIVVAWVDQTRSGGRSTLLTTDANGRYVAGTGGYSFKRWAFPGQDWTGAIGRGFVVVNARERTVKPGFGSGITRGNLLLHELGHVVGLEHTSSTDELMHSVLLPRTSTGYRSGDLAGLAKVGVEGGCIEVPSSVWTDL